ncbi:MAG: cell envelope integrity protein TolA [Methylophilaceae bacterium]
MRITQLEKNYELQANLFSFVIHVILFIFMIFTIQWKTNEPYFAEVELWDAIPTQVKPKVVEPVARKIITKQKKVTPPPVVKQEKEKIDKAAEIKLKKKKALALKKKKEIEAVQKKILKQERIEKLQERILEQERIEKLQERILEQERIEKLQEQIREKELNKKNNLALKGDVDMKAGINSGELERYKIMIQQKIHQNVNQQLCGFDRIALEFEINLMPTGELVGEPKMTQSSNMGSCDEAVVRAILQSQPLPMPKDKKLFSRLKNLKLKFHPNGID